MAGLGARRTSDDAAYYVAAEHNSYVSGGMDSGPILIPWPGGAKETNLDTTALLVWVITGASIAIVLGIHFSFGGRRLL